jgi:3-oxoacyl-[acyl-carrier protein] reductase
MNCGNVCEESEFTASGYVFATEGVRLALADIQSDSVEQVANEVRDAGGQARAWTLDVGDGAAIAEIAPKAAEELGGLDFVINNAGIVAPVSLDDLSYDQFWHRRLDTMLTAHQRIVRAALPYLRRSSCARIVNVASTEALGATRGTASWAAKASPSTRSARVQSKPE